MNHLDFQGLNDRLLSDAEGLLAAWLPGGRRNGREYICADLTGGKGESLSVNTRTGAWADFATGAKGGDLISLYAAIRGVGQGEAFRQLADGASFQAPALPAPRRTPEFKPEIPPADAPEPPVGEASAVWWYRGVDGSKLFCVARYDKADGSKAIMPWSWDGQRWVKKGWPAPRPLYNLHLLDAPETPVLIVEGEKAAEAAATFAGHVYNVTTWPNGVAGVGSADWSPLHGHRILIWPDADRAGRKAANEIAAKLAPHCPEVKIIDPLLRDADQPEPPKGWDAADSGFDWEAFKAWAKPRVALYAAPAPEPSPVDKAAEAVAKGVDNAGVAPVNPSHIGILTQLGVMLTKGNQPVANQDNCLRVIENHPDFKDIAYWDEFYGKVFTRWDCYTDQPGELREWRDVDTLRLLTIYQRDLGIQRASRETVDSALLVYAHHPSRAKNAPKDWMETLAWDGQDRLEGFLHDYMGAQDNDYTRAAGKNWWISMVARIYSPGCKVDTMLILQGEQGRFKSTAFEVIGGPWYAVSTASVDDPKAFAETMQGKMILELAELASFGKAEADAIKRLLTDRSDRFRAAYAHRAEDYPRRCVLVGTTNKQAVLNDETGGRRFWPVWIERCNIDALRRDRAQLFAEAVARFKRGEDWWEMPASTAQHQESAREHDELEELVEEYISDKPHGVSIKDIWCLGLNFALKDLQRHNQLRIAKLLRALGWQINPIPVKRDGRSVKIWQPIEPPF